MIPNEFKVTSGVKLIGIHGKARAGKDTVANFLVDTYKNHYIQAEADPLKAAGSIAFGIPEDHFHQEEFKETINPLWGVSPRQIAQFLGTEMFRQTISKLVPSIGDNFWVYRALLRINNLYVPEDEGEYTEGDTVIIPDVRFQNEYDFIVSNGGIIIHLTRPGADGNIGIPGHASESGINFTNTGVTYLCDNNGTLNELYRKISEIILSTKY